MVSHCQVFVDTIILARLHRKVLCYSKSLDMLKHLIRLLIHDLKFGEVPVSQRPMLAFS